jgi:7-carboxy-7-deazaguanine synthase
LQPVTPLGATGEPVPPTPAQMLQWQAIFKTQLQDVRVIPQTHKMIHQR